MLSQNFKAVIFDCDGTLVDSEPITVRVLIEYLQEFGLELEFNEAHALFVGRDMQSIATWIEENHDTQLPDIFCVGIQVSAGRGIKRVPFYRFPEQVNCWRH